MEYGMSSQPHWRTEQFFQRGRSTTNHQPVLRNHNFEQPTYILYIYIYMYVCIYHYLHFIRTCSGMSSIPHQSMVASFVAPPFAQGAGGGSEARSHERSGVAYSSKVLPTCCQFPWIYPLDMTNSSPWFFDGRNRWFTELKNGGSFHGKLLNHQMVHGVFSQVFRRFLRHGTPNPVLTDGT